MVFAVLAVAALAMAARSSGGSPQLSRWLAAGVGAAVAAVLFEVQARLAADPSRSLLGALLGRHAATVVWVALGVVAALVVVVWVGSR